jgi:hypothetical protein
VSKEGLNGDSGVFIQREAQVLRDILVKRNVSKEERKDFILQHGEGLRRMTHIIFSREQRNGQGK